MFWDFVSFFFWTFVFVVYLMVLFRILGDLFTDRELNGWLKALWVVFLLFVPFLTALIYLIVRGRSMAQRQAESAKRAKAETDDYIRSVAPASSTSASDEIAKAKSLLNAGTINPAEYEALKRRALSMPEPAQTPAAATK